MELKCVDSVCLPERRNVCHFQLIIAWPDLSTTSVQSSAEQCSVSDIKGQGCGGGWVSVCLFSVKPHWNTWLVFIRLRPRPPPHHFPGWFPNSWEGEETPAHTDIDILPAEIINIIHSLFFGLTDFPTRRRWLGGSQLGCGITWWQGFCLSIKHQPHDRSKILYNLENIFSEGLQDCRTADWQEHQQVLLGCWLLIIVLCISRRGKNKQFYFEWNSSSSAGKI